MCKKILKIVLKNLKKQQHLCKNIQFLIYKANIILTLKQAHMMKSVLELLSLDHKHLDHQLCHPRREASFDHHAIDLKIQQIRNRKEQMRQQADKKRQQMRQKQKRYEHFPLQQILQQSLEPLAEKTSLMLQQKVKFIEDKVYIGTKNNVNNQYITRLIDQNESGVPLKGQLNLLMEEISANLQQDIVDGHYQIYNKKDLQLKKQDTQNTSVPPSKLIQLKKMELSTKIQELKDQLSKTEQQQQKLSPKLNKSQVMQKPYLRSASVNSQYKTLNLQDFSIKSERTKKADQFIKKIQKQQEQFRRQKIKKQEQMKKMQVKSMQEKNQFQQQIKNQKHQALKKSFQKKQQQKKTQKQKQEKLSQQYLKFLSQYKGRKPLFRQKQEQFIKKQTKIEKQHKLSVLSQIKQAKRSIDISQLKEHEKKYQLIRKQFQEEKSQNLKHRQRQIVLRQKRDKLYYRGRYHSMIKQEQQKVPEDPTLKRDQLIKKKKQFAQKVKKQFLPQANQSKQKQLQQLISQINRNKPNKESKDSIQIGNNYLKELHKLIKQMKQEGRVKVQLPEQIKPRYKNYLEDIKKKRQTNRQKQFMYASLQVLDNDTEYAEMKLQRIQENAKKREKVLALTENIDVKKQMKEISDLDMEYLRAAKLKLSLLQKYDPQDKKSKTKGERESSNSDGSDDDSSRY